MIVLTVSPRVTSNVRSTVVSTHAYTDPGRSPVAQPFTGGPLWVEYLALRLRQLEVESDVSVRDPWKTHCNLFSYIETESNPSRGFVYY